MRLYFGKVKRRRDLQFPPGHKEARKKMRTTATIKQALSRGLFNAVSLFKDQLPDQQVYCLWLRGECPLKPIDHLYFMKLMNTPFVELESAFRSRYPMMGNEIVRACEKRRTRLGWRLSRQMRDRISARANEPIKEKATVDSVSRFLKNAIFGSPNSEGYRDTLFKRGMPKERTDAFFRYSEDVHLRCLCDAWAGREVRAIIRYLDFIAKNKEKNNKN